MCHRARRQKSCGVTATYWLDIDAAGLAGQPLEIMMWGGSTSSPSNLPYVAGFMAEMIKK